MQRQLQESVYTRRLIRLGCSCAEADRLAITDGRIIAKSCGIKTSRRLSIKEEPVHSRTEFSRTNCLRNPLELFATLIGIEPGVQTMHPNLTTRRDDPLQLRKQFVDVVAASTHRRSGSLRRAAGAVRAWDHKKCRSMSAVQFEVSVEAAPSVLCDPQMHERKQASRLPVPHQAANRFPAAQHLEEYPNRRAIDKAEHCVITPMVTQPRMVDIVRKTRDETESIRNWRYFYQRYPSPRDPITHNLNMLVESRDACIGRRLTVRQ